MKDCEDMLNLVKDANITCISTIDKYASGSKFIRFPKLFMPSFSVLRINCIEKISKGEADIVPLEPEEVYVAHRFQPVGFRVVAEVRSQEFKDRKLSQIVPKALLCLDFSHNNILLFQTP